MLIPILLAAAAAQTYPPLKREAVLDQPVPQTTTRQVKGATIHFAPGQPSGRHRHPIPVVGQVTEGSFDFQVEGQPLRRLNKGDAFYEPAGVVVVRFDNASPSEPAAITAFYLMDRADRPLIELLPK